jgi:CheY-like chemotaxis protein
VPIVALSAAVMEADREMARDSGMNDHLAKPIDAVELQNILLKYFKEVGVKHVTHETAEVLRVDGVDMDRLKDKLQPDMIKKFLKTFAQTQCDFCEKIATLPIESKEFKMMIHSIKGVSGNLAMTNINALAKACEETQEEYKMTQIRDELCRYITSIISSIDSMQESCCDEQETDSSTQEETLELIDNTLKIVQSNALIEDNDLKKLMNAISTHVSKAMAQEIHDAIEIFDFKTAADKLEKIKETLQS